MTRLLLAAACALLAACGSSGAPGVDPPASSTGVAASSAAAPVASSSSSAPSSAVPTSSAAAASSAAPSSAPAPPGLTGGACGDETCFSVERCEAGQCVPACPDGEVYIPRTPAEGFTMGRGKVLYGFGKLKGGTPGNGIADEPHKVVLTRPFCMDATEVTVRAIVACVKEQGCREPSIFDRWATYPKKLDHPVNMVEWDIAKDYCEKQSQSLPTEAQWEWAAMGGDGRDWPWGNEHPTCEHADFTEGNLPSPGGDAGCHGGGPSPVGTHTKGDRVLPTGRIHDLAGNVWEWTLDSYGRMNKEPKTDPVRVGDGDLTHVVKGGGWNRSHKGIMSWFRGAAIHTYKVPGLGFRCVRNPR